MRQARLQEVEDVLVLADKVDRLHQAALHLEQERAALTDTVGTALQQLISSVSPVQPHSYQTTMNHVKYFPGASRRIM